MHVYNLLFHFCPNEISCTIAAAVILYCVIATIVLPGQWVQGAKLDSKGTRISYKMNGSFVQIGSAVLFWLFSDYGIFNLYRMSIVIDNYLPLLGTLMCFAFLLSTFLYLRAWLWIDQKYQRFHYNNVILDFWCGAELNPHLFGFEIKEFSYRPAFVFIALINMSATAKQYDIYGTVFLPMALFQIISAFYAIDALMFESGLITMFDIIEENFGFMLVFGDYFWMPLAFAIQSYYLIDLQEIPKWYMLVTAMFFLVGYCIFRGSNNQKIQFKEDPTKPIWGKQPQTIRTIRGTELLISGYWSLVRKPNYIGDILIAAAMSMPCQTVSTVPYLYPAYLFLLLLHRAHRDNQRCSKKYGVSWKEYCNKVKWVMFPGIY